jgi:hypothetical protein
LETPIDWERLAAIRELSEYFEADGEGFRRRIETEAEALRTVPAEELDRLALLRVLEVTNGCTQWGFRRGDAEALPAERTRKCMQVVIGFIKQKRIDLPDGSSVGFTPAIEALIAEGRTLYQKAFKANDAEAQLAYFAASTAQFLVYGRDRLLEAERLVNEGFTDLFGPFWIARGRRWIAPYLEAMDPDGQQAVPEGESAVKACATGAPAARA